MSLGTTVHSTCDIAIVGGGLAGQLCVLALAARAPSLSVVLVERGATLGGNQTWCCQTSDLGGAPSLASWFRPLVDNRWDGYRVSFPTFERTLDGEYLCLRSASLARATEHALARNGWSLMAGHQVEEVTATHVRLSGGDTLTAGLVLDARGGDLHRYEGRSGYQKFLGWEIDVEANRGQLPTLPLLMDALPFSPTRLLVEDTYFSRSKDLDLGAVRARLDAYLLVRGIRQCALVREEVGVLPMPWSEPSRRADNRLAIGYRGGFFHPGTGYSLPRAARVADSLARLAAMVPTAEMARAAGMALNDLRAVFRGDDQFARLLNRLAFRVVPPARLRDQVFAPVYGLPAPMLARFYAGRTSLRDRLAIAAAPAGVRLFRQTVEQHSLLGESP